MRLNGNDGTGFVATVGLIMLGLGMYPGPVMIAAAAVFVGCWCAAMVIG